jgi:hypothetical protein
MPDVTASNKLPIHIDSLAQAVSIINQGGSEKQIKRLKNLNKSAHYGEVVKLANKITDQQNATGGTQS